MRLFTVSSLMGLGLTLLVGGSCGDDAAAAGNETEVITTVALTFTPLGGGAAVTFEFDDPDGDGGDPPTVDPIELPAGMYTMAVGFENRLENPPELITEEVRDEADEHQIFFTGSAVSGPASDAPDAALTHAYADTDANGLPIGLTNTITVASGSGELTVTLRHMPPVNGVVVKTAEVASTVRAGGFSAIGGTSDAQVTFSVTVP